MSNTEPTFFHRNRYPVESARLAHEPFTAWDVIRAASEYHRDFGGVPIDLRDPQAVDIPMGPRVAELYVDLLTAAAGGELDALLEDFIDYVEEGE